MKSEKLKIEDKKDRAPAFGRQGHFLNFSFFIFHFSFFILSPISAQPTLLFTTAPQSEVFADSLVRLTVVANPPGKAPDSCALFRSPSAKGNVLAGHDTRVIAARSLNKDSTGVVFSFKAADNDSGKAGTPGPQGPQMGLGFHYLIASCGDGKSLSPELPFWVVSRQAATLTAPKAQETSSNPNIAWTPVPGVPAYHLLLSDQALDINTEKGTVSGASIIWQAITTKSSILYGTPDPSGTFAKVPAPPLSPNVPYNLVVLNNYDGRSSLATSTRAQGLKLFTIQPSGAALNPPKNVAPAPDLQLTMPKDSVMTFRWTRSKTSTGTTANTYRIFIYSLETRDGLDVLFPIWNTEVTDTAVTMDARRALLTKRYIWKVFALSESGASVVGDTTSFRYRNEVQTLSLTVKSDGADPQSVGDVRIEVTPVDGGADPLPLFTTNTGAAEKVLSVGSYHLTFAKDGYQTQTRTVVLDARFPLSVAQILPLAAARLTGKVVDQTGADLVNAVVTASGGGKVVTGVSDAQGFFLLGLAAGTHAIALGKPDYQSRADTTVTLTAGKSLDLGRLTMAQAQGSLTGTVANDKGAPLAGCAVTVKTSTGAVARTLLSDDKGVFSAFLPPGNYTVVVARTGFSTEQKTLQLTEAANLAFTLVSGASLVKGRISIRAWPTAAAPQVSPLPGSIVELIDRLHGVALKTTADLRGEYSFSADTGTWLLKASGAGKARPDSVPVRIAAARSTSTQDLTLAGFASVQGTIKLSPDTLADPSAATVSLLDPATLALVATAVPRREPLPGAPGAMAFSLDGIPDGTFRLACAVPGYGLDAEPAISIADGVWKTGVDLALMKSDKSVTIALTIGGQPAQGIIRLITPRAMEFPAGSRLTEAAAGTYTFTAAADSANVIPVARQSFFLSASGAKDTILTLALPFSHQPAPLSFRDGLASLALNAQARIDSAAVIYGYGAPTDTFRVPVSQLFGPVGQRTFKFKPGPEGGLLTYWFVIKSGSLIYANDEPSRRFQAMVTASRDLAFLRLAAGDSLRLPARARGEIHLHAYDAAGRRLDAEADERGVFTWKADSALGMRLDPKSKRTLDYLTAAASANSGSPPAAPKGSSGQAERGGNRGAGATKRSAEEHWDTLTVTLELDGIEKSLSLPTRVVDAVMNKLVMGSSLGEVSELPAPASFGLFVTGYDTTTTPPTAIVPNPILPWFRPKPAPWARCRRSCTRASSARCACWPGRSTPTDRKRPRNWAPTATRRRGASMWARPCPPATPRARCSTTPPSRSPFPTPPSPARAKRSSGCTNVPWPRPSPAASPTPWPATCGRSPTRRTRLSPKSRA
jgi:hypothetical protein